MQYRRFGKLDFQVSALGFGCMRLPILGGDSRQVDEPLAIEMIRYAIDHGVNYVDSAYGYHGGNSERVIGKALQGGYRDKVKIATKLPPWNVKERADFDRLFAEQLGRLQTDHIDFYLLHNLCAPVWPRLRDLGVREWLDQIKAEGRVGAVGFSFHDTYEVFTEIVDAYDGWTVAQIQYNFLNERVQAGTKGLKYAAKKGLAVVIMEPLLGGSLANPPDPVRTIWDRAPAESSFGVPPSGGLPSSPRRTAAGWEGEALREGEAPAEPSAAGSGSAGASPSHPTPEDGSAGASPSQDGSAGASPSQDGSAGASPSLRTPAEWALQWLWNKPEVAVVLSGMTAMEQVVENVASADHSGIGSLWRDELKLFAKVRKRYESLYPVPCTRCGYCMPCPSGVNIPGIMQLFTDAVAYGGNHIELNRNLYRLLPEGARAGACTACHTCEENCPQQIKVSEWMPRIREYFEK